MKWIKSQSAFFIKNLFQRDYNAMTEDAQKIIDRVVLGVDVVLIGSILTYLM